MTYFWKLEPSVYRIQTDEKIISDKLKKQKFNLVGNGINCKLWIYQLSCKSIKNVRLILQRLTGTKKVKFNSGEDLFYFEGNNTRNKRKHLKK